MSRLNSPSFPSTCSASNLSQRIQNQGFKLTLDTEDFDCWQDAVSSNLGYHRSEPLFKSSPFEARFRVGQLGGFTLVHTQGKGRLRLSREQQGHRVLWLPLKGLSAECING